MRALGGEFARPRADVRRVREHGGAHALLSVGEHDTQGAAFLIVAPLAMRREFRRDAEAMGLTITFVRTDAEVAAVRVGKGQSR